MAPLELLALFCYSGKPMGQNLFHVNLTSKLFPFDFNELSSTVLMGNGFTGEQNRVLMGGFDGEEPVQQYGICQAYFMQNVLPIQRGYQSVHFNRRLLGHGLGNTVKMSDVHILRDNANSVALFSPATGENLVYDADVADWVSLTGPGSLADDVFTCYLRGTTYIFYPNIGVFTYDFTLQTLVQQTVLGLNLANIEGMAAVGPYLVAWDGTQLYWSAYLDALDFVPSQSTGAGSEGVLAIRNKIITCVPIGDGFIIYTASNAVAANFSGNTVFPWIFKEVPESVGISSKRHVAQDTVSSQHICYTPFGVQAVSLRKAELIFPELSDGLARGIYCDFDTGTELPRIVTDSLLDVKMNQVSIRYICISIRTQADAVQKFPYRFCYVYDTLLSRWGRVDIDHVDVLEFVAPDFARSDTYDEFAVTYPTYADIVGISYSDLNPSLDAQSSIPNKNFAFVQQDGVVYTVSAANSTEGAANDDAVALTPAAKIFLGKFKIQRGSGLCLEQVKVNHIQEDAYLVAHSHDYNGNYVSFKEITTQAADVAAQYFARHVGDSLSFQLQGRFTLTDLQFAFSPAGRKNMPKRPSTVNNLVNSGITVVSNGVVVNNAP